MSQSSGGWVPVSVLTAEVVNTLLGGVTKVGKLGMVEISVKT